MYNKNDPVKEDEIARYVARMRKKSISYRISVWKPGPGVYSASNRNEYRKH
jgi:hypothetical protein